MKRLILLIIGLIFPLILLSGSVSAVDVFGSCTSSVASTGKTDVCQSVSASNKANNDPIIDALKVVLNVLSLIIGAAAVIMMVISGIRFISSGGDANAVKSARDGLIYVSVGLLVTVMAQAIVLFVLDKVS